MQAGLAAICFIIDDGNILLMEAPWQGNQWSVIGGKMEAGETPEAAVRREVFEETGLVLGEVREAGHVLLYGADARDATCLYLFVSRNPSGELRGSDEGLPSWHRLDSLDQLAMIDIVPLLLPTMLQPDTMVSGTIDLNVDRQIGSHTLRVHHVSLSRNVAHEPSR